MTDGALPEPMVPADCDLRGLPWMPVDTVRLLDSDLWALSTGEEFKAAFKIWCKAWQQVPASSLPDDDRILASLSGTGRLWPRLKPMAMRGFMKCADGRLYHPVIAEKALEAWEHRKAQRARANKRWDKSGSAAAHATASATAMQGTETGTATGKRQGPKKPTATTSSAGDPAGRTVPIWLAYAEAYQRRYGVEPVRNKQVNGMLARYLDKLPTEEAPLVAAFYVTHSKGLYVSARHCVDLLLRDAEGLRTEWASGRRVTDTAARHADQTATRGDQAERLIAEQHGERKVA